MHWKRLLLVLAALAAIALQACNDDIDPPTGQPGIPNPVNAFPHTVGMLWKYQVYDSLTSTTDTVWVSVTELRESAAILTVQQWRMAWHSGDSVLDLVATAASTTGYLDFWTDTTQTEPDFVERFEFPLVDGARWVDAVYPGDTSRVTLMRSVTVPAGTFNTVARVDRAWNVDFEGGGNWSTTWISNSVGFVKRYYLSTSSDGATVTVTKNETWALLEFDLTTFAQPQFPNTVGSEWVYELIDTANDLADTVTVSIVDIITLSGADSAAVWVFTGHEYVDTMIVAVRENWIYVYPDTLATMPFINWYYEFPLTLGRDWGIYTFAAVPGVYDKGPVSTPAGDFPGSFHFRASGGAFNDYWTVEERLVPGVGAVRRTFTKFGFWPAKYEEWTLLSYDVAP